MSFRKNDDIIDRRNLKIIVNSSFTDRDEYKWIKDYCIKNNCSSISEADLENFTEQQKSFINGSLYRDFYIKCCDEWDVDYTIEQSETDTANICELCGKKHLQYLFFLRNKINNKKLVVGSKCIESYMEFSDKNNKQKIHYMANKVKLNNEKPGINEFINSMDDFEDTLSIYVKEDLIRKYDALCRVIEKQYNNVCNSFNKKTKETLFSNINTLCNLQKEMTKYDKLHSSDIWSVTPEIKRWCKKNINKENIIKYLRKSIYIKLNSAILIKEENFKSKIDNEMRKQLKKYDIKLLNSTMDNYLISKNGYDNIKLDVSYTDALKLYGEGIFNNEVSVVPTDDEFYSIVHITDSESIYEASRNIAHNIKNELYFLSEDSAESSLDKVYFRDFSKNVVYTLDGREFVNKFKSLIYKNKLTNDEKNEVLEYILSKPSEKYKDYNANKILY